MSDEEDYVQFGTPLELLDEDACPRKKPLLIEEQVAKDKHGRRRFHGAFTGGFSAGFLNTVGSAEGFKPSSFKSSKTEKGTVLIQKPEHFMDEEDVGEFGIAPSVLRPSVDYQSFPTDTRTHPDHSARSGLGASMLKSLIQPVRETIGIKLLRKMGWKPGQGVGPRITKNEKKRISRMRVKVYGCSLPNEKSVEDDSESDIDDEELKNITFAPSDCPFQLVTPKDNLFGIGYKGLDKRSILSVPQVQSEFTWGNKKTITGQAFGVGALEEEDEDIYTKEDMSQYDFALGDNAKDTASASDCVTGEDLYDIFVLGATKRLKKSFPFPVIPDTYKPIRKTTRFEPLPETKKAKKLSPSPERMSTSQEAEEIQKEARKLTQTLPTNTQSVFKPFISDIDKQARYEKYLQLSASGKPGDLSKHQPITMTEWDKERERIEFEQAAKLFKPLTGVMEDRFTVGSQPEDLNDPLASVEKLKSGSDDEIKAAKMNMYGPLTRTTEDWKPCSLLCKRFNIRELNTNEIPIVQNKPKYSIFDDFTISLQEANRKPQTQAKDTSEPLETDKNETTKEGKEQENFDLNNLPENKIDLFNAIFLDTDSEDEFDARHKSKIQAEEDVDKKMEMLYHETITNEKRNTSPARGIFENLDYDLLLFNKSKAKTPAVTKKDVADPRVPDPRVPDPRVPDPRVAGSRVSDSRVAGTRVPDPRAHGSRVLGPRVPGPARDEPRNPEVKKRVNRFEDGGINIELIYGPKLPDKFPEKKMDFAPEAVNNECWVEKSATAKKHKKDKKHKKSSKHKSKYKVKDKDRDKDRDKRREYYQRYKF